MGTTYSSDPIYFRSYVIISLNMRFFLAILFIPFLVTTALADYLLAPGDTVEVVFKNEKQYTTVQKISVDGTINLPFLEILKVAGLTQPELQEKLKKDFAQYLAKDMPLVYIKPRPVYIVWHNLESDETETQVIENVEEAKAIVGKYYKGSVKPGKVIHIEQGKPFSWWEKNWYKILSALALVISIVN